MVKTKNKVYVMCVTLLALLLAVVLGITANSMMAKAYLQTDFTNDINSMIFTSEDAFEFLPVSETECSVKLVDKTLQTVRVPQNVTIEEQEYIVKEVVPNGFASASDLQTVIFPKTVIKLGSAAFQNCSNLELVYCPNVQEIGMSAFAFCPQLRDIIFPATLETVGTAVFMRNTTKVHARFESAPNSWSSGWNTGNTVQLADHDFNGLDDNGYLWKHDFIYEEKVNIRTRLVEKQLAPMQPLSEDIDHGDKTIEADTINIAAGAFWGTNLRSLAFAKSELPINIESMAFNYMVIEEGITINREVTYCDPNGDESIMVFNTVTAKYITLPTPEKIVAGMFFFNNVLNINFIDLEEMSYEKVAEKVVQVPGEVNEIKQQAFCGVTSIDTIHIPNSVKAVGAEAFSQWTADQTIHVPFLSEAQCDKVWGADWKRDCAANVEYFGRFSLVSMPDEIYNPNEKYYYVYTLEVPNQSFFEGIVLSLSQRYKEGSSALDRGVSREDSQLPNGNWVRTWRYWVQYKSNSMGGCQVSIKTTLELDEEIIDEQQTPYVPVHVVFRTAVDFINYDFDGDYSSAWGYYLYADVNFGTYTSVDGRGRGLKQNLYNDLHGNGHTITYAINIGTLPAPRGISTGLFYENYAEISNLKINASINIPNYETLNGQTGGIGCYGLVWTNYKTGYIKDCVVTMSANTNCPNSKVGGIAIYNEGTIENCSVYGNITAKPETTFVGGVAAVNWQSSEIKGCTNFANINGYGQIGGIAGQNSYQSTILNCINRGTITLNSLYVKEGKNSYGEAGGIVASNWKASCLGCTNNGTIKFGVIETPNNSNWVQPAMAQIAGSNDQGTIGQSKCLGTVDSGPLTQISGVNQKVYVSSGEIGRTY